MSLGKVIGSSDQYCLQEVIAKGAFSVVHRCTERRTGRVYAAKVISRKTVERHNFTDALTRELNAMEVARNCPYVVRLVDQLVSRHNFYIIMELAGGGTVLDLIRERAHQPSLEWVPAYFKQLMTGLAALHEQHVAHRDIKPENILLNSARTRVMISDFGFACCFEKGLELHRACGTLKFCAPELLVEAPSYDGAKVDVWAAGVTLYLMLYKRLPFYFTPGSSADAYFNVITRTSYTIPPSTPPGVAEVLAMMLTVDPSRRATAATVLRHPWLQGVDASAAAASTRAGTPPVSQDRRKPPPRRRTTSADSLRSISFMAERGGPLDTQDDGFFEHACAGSDEETGRGAHARGLVLTFSATCRPNQQHWPNLLPSPSALSSPLRQSSSVPSFGPARGSPSPVSSFTSSVGDPLLSAAELRPSSLQRQGRGLWLTARVVFNFIFFCVVLLVVSMLRALFAMGLDDLPLPAKVRELVEYLLVPPYERSPQRRALRGSHDARIPGSRVRGFVRYMERALSASQLHRWIAPQPVEVVSGGPPPGAAPMRRSSSASSSGVTRPRFGKEDVAPRRSSAARAPAAAQPASKPNTPSPKKRSDYFVGVSAE